MARPHRFQLEPELPKEVAQAYIDGYTQKEIGERFDVSADTVGRWIRDPRVQVIASRMAGERITRITRKIDNEIEARLANVADMDTDQILKIRKEFLERSLKIDTSALHNDAQTIDETIKALDKDPELANQLMAILGESTGAE